MKKSELLATLFIQLWYLSFFTNSFEYFSWVVSPLFSKQWKVRVWPKHLTPSRAKLAADWVSSRVQRVGNSKCDCSEPLEKKNLRLSLLHYEMGPHLPCLTEMWLTAWVNNCYRATTGAARGLRSHTPDDTIPSLRALPPPYHQHTPLFLRAHPGMLMSQGSVMPGDLSLRLSSSHKAASAGAHPPNGSLF